MSAKLNAINTVTNYIRNGIISGLWKIGDKLPSEHEICKTLDVERSHVRSALSQYVSLGLLKSVHGKGTFVCSTCSTTLGSGISSSSMINTLKPILDFRFMIEPEVCYRAASKSSTTLITMLESILINHRASINNIQQSVYFDMLFHINIAKSIENPFLTDTLSNLLFENTSYFLILNESVGAYNGIYYHTEIFHAIKSSDAKKARSLMSEHLEKTISELDQYINTIS